MMRSSASSVTGSSFGKKTGAISKRRRSMFLRAMLRAAFSRMLVSSVVRISGYSSVSGFKIGIARRSGLSGGTQR